MRGETPMTSVPAAGPWTRAQFEAHIWRFLEECLETTPYGTIMGEEGTLPIVKEPARFDAAFLAVLGAIQERGRR